MPAERPTVMTAEQPSTMAADVTEFDRPFSDRHSVAVSPPSAREHVYEPWTLDAAKAALSLDDAEDDDLADDSHVFTLDDLETLPSGR